MEFSSQHHHRHQRQHQQQQQNNNPHFCVEEQEESYHDLLDRHHDNHGSSVHHHNHDYDGGEQHDDKDDDDDDDDENPTTATAFIPTQVAAAAAAAMVIVDDNDYSPSTVMHRIQQLTFALVDALEEERMPVVTSLDADNTTVANTTTSAAVVKTQFSLHQARNMTSLFLVLSYCFGLLQEGKTTTLREVVRTIQTNERTKKMIDCSFYGLLLI
jgi:hypothetical protein